MPETVLSDQQKAIAKQLAENRNSIYKSMRSELPYKIPQLSQRSKQGDYLNKDFEITLEQWAEVAPKIEIEKANSKWVGDNVVSAYMKMLQNNGGKIWYVDSSLATTVIVHEDMGEKKTKAPLAKFLGCDVNHPEFLSRKHYWPFITGGHWVLIVVDLQSQVFAIYESQNRGNRYKSLIKILNRFYSRYHAYDTKENIEIVKNVAIEPNNSENCGVFVMMQAAVLCGKAKPMLYRDFRTRVAFELLSNTLLDKEPTQDTLEQFSKLLRQNKIHKKDCASPQELSLAECNNDKNNNHLANYNHKAGLKSSSRASNPGWQYSSCNPPS